MKTREREAFMRKLLAPLQLSGKQTQTAKAYTEYIIDWWRRYEKIETSPIIETRKQLLSIQASCLRCISALDGLDEDAQIALIDAGFPANPVFTFLNSREILDEAPETYRAPEFFLMLRLLQAYEYWTFLALKDMPYLNGQRKSIRAALVFMCRMLFLLLKIGVSPGKERVRFTNFVEALFHHLTGMKVHLRREVREALSYVPATKKTKPKSRTEHNEKTDQSEETAETDFSRKKRMRFYAEYGKFILFAAERNSDEILGVIFSFFDGLSSSKWQCLKEDLLALINDHCLFLMEAIRELPRTETRQQLDRLKHAFDGLSCKVESLSNLTLDLLDWSSNISGENPFKYFLGGDQDEIKAVRAKNESAFLPKFLRHGAKVAECAAYPIASQSPGPSDTRTSFASACLRLFRSYSAVRPSSAGSNPYYQFTEALYGAVTDFEDFDLHEPIRRAIKRERDRQAFREAIKSSKPLTWDELNNIPGFQLCEVRATDAWPEMMNVIRTKKE